MNKYLFIIAIGFIIVLNSCSDNLIYENSNLFSRNDFENIFELKGKVLFSDSVVYKPQTLQVYDSLLIVKENGNKHFVIYNLNTMKKVGERISVGQGPKELIYPLMVKNYDKSIFIHDLQKMTLIDYSKKDFLEQANPIPLSTIKLEKRALSLVALLDEGFIGYSYDPHHPLFKFDQQGKYISNIMEYPICRKKDYTDTERMDAFQFFYTTNLSDKVFVCYGWTDLIELLDSEGNVLKRLHGPDKFYPHFKEVRESKIITTVMEKNVNRNAYFCPTKVNDCFWALYSGKLENQNDLLCNEIFVFDKNGNPKTIYKLDHGIFTFAIDEIHRKIYGISNQPEYYILEYRF